MKKLIRKNFRESVFQRDGYRCKTCHCPGKDRQGNEEWEKYHSIEPEAILDAHHITDRSEFPNQGYVTSNGISLCEKCHIKAEKYHISSGQSWEDGFHPNDLYKMINSSKEKAIQDDSNY
ncbi:MAG: hypothetical protein DWQ19_09355 [Crenarchaeota archaeon]|nr:MAG: hypothetical protein DWQ19_09355 [Thermoproteota archaeon]